MRKLFFFITVTLYFSHVLCAQVGINADNMAPDPSAMLDVNSTTKGILIPRLTTAQRDSILAPAEYLMILNTTTRCFEAFNAVSSLWESIHCFGNCLTPTNPTAGIHVPSPNQIVWHWNTVSDATGYKWCTINNYHLATDLGLGTSVTETGLSCNTNYSCYVWSYTACGVSLATTMTQNTSMNPPVAPVSGSHVNSCNTITWKWEPVVGATGYKWNSINDFASATDMLATILYTETNLYPNSNYTRFVWAYNSCGVSTPTTLTQTLPFLIGQNFGGGIIFYIDGTGLHGLISAASNQSTGVEWGCSATTIGNTSSAIGTGQANTTNIVTFCSTAGIAARICFDLVLNGYDDWFLPSKNELYQMYVQRAVIGGFGIAGYWSSTEYGSSQAWYQSFSGSTTVNYKDNGLYVRAVRAF